MVAIKVEMLNEKQVDNGKYPLLMIVKVCFGAIIHLNTETPFEIL